MTCSDAHKNDFDKMTAYLASFVQHGKGGGRKISAFHGQGSGGGRHGGGLRSRRLRQRISQLQMRTRWLCR